MGPSEIHLQFHVHICTTKGSLPSIKGHLTKACAGAVLVHVLPAKTSEQTWLTFSEKRHSDNSTLINFYL